MAIKNPLARREPMPLEAIADPAAPWLAYLQELANAKTTSDESAVRERWVARALDADPADELALLSLPAVDANLPSYLRDQVLARLTDPARPLVELTGVAELMVYKLQNAEPREIAVTVERGMFSDQERRQINVGRIAGHVLRLAAIMRHKRQEAADNAVRVAAGVARLEAGIAAMKVELERCGDWSRLMVGSPVVVSWLHSADFSAFAYRFDTRVSPVVLRQQLLALAARERASQEAAGKG